MDDEKPADESAIKHFSDAITAGKRWHIALLEAIGMWMSPDEYYDGQYYHYFISGEAFDWLLLARRLCHSIDGLIPEEEKVALFNQGQSVLNITREEFKNYLGNTKYSAHLNFFYGVTIEKSLIQAVQEEIYKEIRLYPCCQDKREFEGAYQRIYGKDEFTLLKQFIEGKNNSSDNDYVNNVGSSEFTYWLFKYRLNNNDRAKMASDTQKGIKYYNQRQSMKKRNITGLETSPDFISLQGLDDTGD